MHLKSLQELLKYFILSLFTTLYIGVFWCIVFAFDVSYSENSITIVVNLFKGLNYELSSELIHGTNNNSDEFIKINISIAIEIESLE